MAATHSAAAPPWPQGRHVGPPLTAPLSLQDIFKQATEDRLTSAKELPYFEGDFWPNVLEESIKELEQEEEERKKEESTAAGETPEVQPVCGGRRRGGACAPGLRRHFLPRPHPVPACRGSGPAPEGAAHPGCWASRGAGAGGAAPSRRWMGRACSGFSGQDGWGRDRERTEGVLPGSPGQMQVGAACPRPGAIS